MSAKYRITGVLKYEDGTQYAIIIDSNIVDRHSLPPGIALKVPVKNAEQAAAIIYQEEKK
jgi:hypothetical protein